MKDKVYKIETGHSTIKMYLPRGETSVKRKNPDRKSEEEALEDSLTGHAHTLSKKEIAAFRLGWGCRARFEKVVGI